MNWKNIFTVFLRKLRDSLRDRRTLILALVIPTLVMPALLFGMGTIISKVMTTAREEVPVAMVELWPFYGVGPLLLTMSPALR